MSTTLEAMLANYETTSVKQRRHALREVAQEIILCGLSRADFFSYAAFYGGTALRMFYGLDRFSEDMDFSLCEPDPEFDLMPYLTSAERECAVWGLRFHAEMKKKTRDSPIRSAFLKAGTRQCLITLFSDDGVADAIMPGEQFCIKLELDTDPAAHATFEKRFRLLPSPYEVQLYDAPSLFAGKTHAVLARAWKHRVKGRDLYDYVFYRSRNTPVNLELLHAKLVQTGHADPEDSFDLAKARSLLYKRFGSIDFAQAKEDVLPFISDTRSLDVWGEAFFCSITDGLTGT